MIKINSLGSNHRWLVPLALFAIAFVAGPLSQFHGLSRMPGNLIDSRLNNYFLENIYQFLKGNSPSLVHLTYFYPFPYVLGFCDNLFGASPAYLLPRLLTGQSDTAFQVWFLAGYAANYAAAYWALRRLSCSVISASIGALIFTFALPISGQTHHPQLQYRFGVPLAAAFLISFLEQKNWSHLIGAMGWMLWQIYCSIYIGFFLLELLAVITVIYLIKHWRDVPALFRIEFLGSWKALPQRKRLQLLLSLMLLASLTFLIFYPYLQVSLLYGAKRDWATILNGLPRPQSYFIADHSQLWSSASAAGTDISPQCRQEHRLFIGLIPWLLTLTGLVLGYKQKQRLAYSLLATALGMMILLTLNIHGHSLWKLFAEWPLASAIRAGSRIILVLLFPVAFLAALAADRILESSPQYGKLFMALIFSCLVLEFSLCYAGESPKSLWRTHLSARDQTIPTALPPDAILFLAQENRDYFQIDEVDAMWLSLQHRLPTLNGYSGVYPPEYNYKFGTNSLEIVRRINAYLHWTGKTNDLEAYRSLIRRVVPIGFSPLNPEWLNRPPSSSQKLTAKKTESNPEMEYQKQLERIRESMNRLVPAGATLLVFTEGEDSLLQMNGRVARPFPQETDGTYAASRPENDADAIAQFEALRKSGARYVLIPAIAFWWLDSYPEFYRHLKETSRRVARDPDYLLLELSTPYLP